MLMVYNFLIIEDSIPLPTAIREIIRSSLFNVGQFFEASRGKEGLKILNEEIHQRLNTIMRKAEEENPILKIGVRDDMRQ